MFEKSIIVFLICSATFLIKNSLAESCISQNSCFCRINEETKIDISSLVDNQTQYLEDTQGNLTYLFSGCKDIHFKDYNGIEINTTASLLLLNKTDKTHTILGTASNIHFNKNAVSNYYEIIYNHKSEVSAKIVLICVDFKVPLFKTVDSKSEEFALVSPKGCLIVEPHGMSGGSKFLLTFFILTLIYLVGGVLIMYFIRGARGLEVIPNVDFWKNLPSLVKDGVIFLLSGCRPTLITSAETYDRI